MGLEKIKRSLEGAPSAFESVSASDYTNEEEYLDAVTMEQMKRNSAEYREARRKIEAEYQERLDKQQQEENAKKYKEIRSNVLLSALDENEIDKEAHEMAYRDVLAKRIFAGDIGASIDKYKRNYAKKRDEKSTSALFNEILRGGN